MYLELNLAYGNGFENSLSRRMKERTRGRMKKWLQINYFMEELLKQLFCWPWPGSSFRSRLGPQTDASTSTLPEWFNNFPYIINSIIYYYVGIQLKLKSWITRTRTRTSHITDFLSFARPSRDWRWVISVSGIPTRS